MAWYKNRAMYLSAILGVIVGTLFLLTGLWLEMQRQGLPFSMASYFDLHERHYVFFLLDLAPFGFGILFGLVGMQRSLNSVISQSKKEWETTFDVLSEPIFITNDDGKIIRCNHAVLDRLNVSYLNVIGRQLTDILGTGQKKDSSEVNYPDAEFPWLGRLYDMAIYPIHLPGMPENIVCVLHDITERKQAEKALRDSEAQLRGLFSAMSDVVIVYDKNGKYVSIAPTHPDLLVKPPEELIGKTLVDVFPKSEADRLLGSIRTVLDLRRILQVEFALEIGEKVMWVSAIFPPMPNELVIWVARDVTERRRIELETLKQKQYFESLVKNSPVAIVVMDNEEKIVSINPAFEHLYGYTSEEAVGVVLDVLITTDETRAEAARYSQEIMEGAIHGIVRRRRKDGTLVDVELSGVPIIFAGEKLGGLALYHDITELVHARREAEEANRAKSEFLANMSHEIRTPMNGVMGMLEITLDTQLTSEQRDYLQTSLHSAESLLSLLNDILDFSKIESGKLDLDVINFSLRNAVEDVAYTLAKRAHEKGLEIACLIDPGLASNLRGDPGRLRQILVNLVGNAIKFTHQGEIVIRAETLEQNENSATVHFSVQDTGIGIPYDRQAAVFERFTQADGSTTRTYGGTGLGLTISKQLVEIMGGEIGLESTPGIGTTFWFDIAFEKTPLEKRDTAPLTLGPANLTFARVLVVDDNQTNRMVLTKNVEALGSRVDTASSGAKALEILHNAQRAGDPYHIVLLDMQMPVMDGEQISRAIKSDPSIKDVKILILTSMGQRGDAIRLQALGCSGYLLKPVKQQMLFDAVIAVLGSSERQPTGLITRHVIAEKRKSDLRILLAEDNPINQKLTIVLLQKAGYSVDAVDNGLQALERVQANRYSTILMDVQMPDMDGFEATRQIRILEQSSGQHIPIIAMTAHAMAGDRERCIAAGMDDYVSKPLEPRVLFSALDRWTQNIREDEALPASFETLMPASVIQEDSYAEKLPVDLEAALFRFDNDRTFMLDMCREFNDHLPERVTELQSALLAGDMEKLCRFAHNLKGLSLNFNASGLSTLAAKLEVCSKGKNATEAPILVEQIVSEITRVREYLSQHLS